MCDAGCNGERERRAAWRLRLDQKLNLLLRVFVFCFSQRGDLVFGLFSRTPSTAVACLVLPRHRRFVWCEADLDCFLAAVETVLRRFVKAVLDAETNVQASG